MTAIFARDRQTSPRASPVVALAASVVTYLSVRVVRVALETSAEPTRARPRQKE
jgi:hypothetical protein